MVSTQNNCYAGTLDPDVVASEITRRLLLQDRSNVNHELKLFVFFSSKLEKTIPQNIPQTIITKLDCAKHLAQFPCEASHSQEEYVVVLSRLTWYYRAARQLFNLDKLCCQSLIDAHTTMLAGCSDVAPGLRTAHVFALKRNNEPVRYTLPENIAQELQDFQACFLDNFHDLSDIVRVCDHAARAVARFLEIHPFRNGNGRVGRLLVAWMVHQKTGVVPLLNTHRKARKHWLKGLTKAQKCPNQAWFLRNLILESTNNSLGLEHKEV